MKIAIESWRLPKINPR